MSTSISLSNGIILSKNDKNELLLKKENNDILTLTNGQILQNQKLLSPNQSTCFLHEIIKAEFFIPEQMQIIKLKHSGKNTDNFNLKIEAKAENSTVSIDFSNQKGNIKFEKKTTNSNVLSKHQTQTKITTEVTEIDDKNKTFSENSQDETNIAGDRYTTNRGQSLKRTFGKNGKSLNLEAIKQETDSECPEFIDNKTTLEITSKQIIKQISQNSDHLKRKFQITYDLTTHTIECKLRETEYNAYTLIEYKDTLLTPIFKKKAVIRTPFDRNLTAKLTINDKGNSTYFARETTPDMTEKEISIENNLQQIPEIIKSELKQIKEIAAKVSIIKNAQDHNPKADFSSYSQLFEPYIGFTNIRDRQTCTLVTALTSAQKGEQSLHNLLLSQLHLALNTQALLQNGNTKKSR